MSTKTKKRTSKNPLPKLTRPCYSDDVPILGPLPMAMNFSTSHVPYDLPDVMFPCEDVPKAHSIRVDIVHDYTPLIEMFRPRLRGMWP